MIFDNQDFSIKGGKYPFSVIYVREIGMNFLILVLSFLHWLSPCKDGGMQ